VQRCKLYFGELGTRGWEGRQWGEDKRRKEREREREKERSEVRQLKQARKGAQGRSVTTPTGPAVSSQLSLYAGAEVPMRMGSGKTAVRMEKKNNRALRGACAVLL